VARKKGEKSFEKSLRNKKRVVDLHPVNEAICGVGAGALGAPRSSKVLFCLPCEKRKIFFFQKSLADKKKAVHLQPLWETGRTKIE
jgi:hypothetical protein